MEKEFEEGVKKQRKSTNVQFTEEQMVDIEKVMREIGIGTIADFVKFSCKQVCNSVEVFGAIAFPLGKKIKKKSA